MKRIIRCILAAAFAVCFFRADAAAADGGVRVPILMYHEVKYSKLGKDAISPWELESDLRVLRAGGYTPVTVDSLIGYVLGDGALPDKPVVLSFDDGYMNNHKFALPLLQKYAVPFTLSLIVKNTDEFSLDPSTSIDYAHMTWEQVLEMAAGGAEVLNHSYNLHGWGRGRTGCAQKYGESAETYRAALTEDLLRAQARIFEMTDRVPRAFAYPYGKYNDCANGVLRQLGFLATLTCDYGVNVLKKGDPDCLFNLKRICRAHGESAEKIINEAMKTLR